ncbi:MAG TPA: DUF952 domain-containing protein [Symbiobacteriaceae bacterium]|nr:DUF952 domain-containing protein [Symbiobacteriaceae bacterium]
MLITRMLEAAAWAEFQRSGLYAPPALALEGSIWCTTPETVANVATMLFRGKDDLILLLVDPAGLQIEWRPYEGALYPHLLEPLPLGAVVRAIPWAPEADGSFRYPQA